jgi:hypothetical protein
MNSQNQSQLSSCYIKQVFTENYIQYTFSTSITVTSFIEGVKMLFVESMNVYPEKMEVIEAGQEIPHVKAEDAPKLQDENISIQEKYGDQIKNKAFYIRYTNP